MNRRVFQFLLPVAAIAAGTFAGYRSAVSPGLDNSAAPAATGLLAQTAAESVAADPVARLIGAARACHSLRDLARLGPQLEALDALQLGTLLDALDRDAAFLDFDLLAPILAWWFSRDPGAANAWVEAGLERRFAFPEMLGEIPAMLDRWAELAPDEVRRVVRDHPDHPLSGVLLGAVFQHAWPGKKLPARLADLLECPAGLARLEAVMKFRSENLFEAEPEEFRAALPLLEKLSARERELFLYEYLPRFSSDAPAEALDLAVRLQLANPNAWQELFSAAFSADADATRAWIEAADPALVATHAGAIAKVWLGYGSAAALDWAAAHGVLGVDTLAPADAGWDELQEKFGRTVGRTNYWYDGGGFRQSFLSQALDEDHDAVLDWLRARPAGPSRDALLELASRSLGPPPPISGGPPRFGDSREATSWKFSALAPLLLELPPEPAQQAIYQLMKSISPWEMHAGILWAKTLPPGPIREQAWVGLGETGHMHFNIPINGKLSEDATLPRGPDLDATEIGEARWRATDLFSAAHPSSSYPLSLYALRRIENPDLRRQTFDDLFADALADPRAKARSMRDHLVDLLDFTDVPDEWKARWLAKLKPAAVPSLPPK